MNDTCPHCGAARRYEERYDCGTFIPGVVPADKPEWIRSLSCYERQLAAVTAERDALARRIADNVDLAKLRAEVDSILAESRTADELRGEPINWGDLHCWSVRKWVDQDGDWGWTVYIEEADSRKLAAYVDGELQKRGYPPMEVETSW